MWYKNDGQRATTKFNAFQSLGYPQNSTNLSAEKLEKLKQLAQKASNTYPPPFREKSQKEHVHKQENISDEGKQIAEAVLERGRQAIKNLSRAPTDSGFTGK